MFAIWSVVIISRLQDKRGNLALFGTCLGQERRKLDKLDNSERTGYCNDDKFYGFSYSCQTNSSSFHHVKKNKPK